MGSRPLAGVYAAALTPLKADFTPDIEILPEFLGFLADRDCHGALLMGTTGEGPSFSLRERTEIWQSACQVHHVHPDFHLLAGTGTPSLQETTALTRTAFNLGFDGAVILPPYYFRSATQEGLFRWFSEVIRKAVPSSKNILCYHIPQLTGVTLSIDLLMRLRDAFPDRCVGIKDSSGDPKFAKTLGEKLSSDFVVLTGNDKLFSTALESGASGCITASANLISPCLRKIWDSYEQGSQEIETQSWVRELRTKIDNFRSPPALYKFLLSHYFNFPRWPVRPPLLPLPQELEQKAISEIIINPELR